MLEQRFSRALGGDLSGAGEQRVQIAELRQELLRPLLPDPLHPRHVVRRIADERQEVGDLAGWDAQSLSRVGLIHPHLVNRRRTAAARIQQGHVRADELVEVLVARHDHGLESGGGRLHRQRADHIVRLVAGYLDRSHSKRVEQLPRPLHRAVEVRLELLIELLTSGLVVGVTLLAERGARVEHPGEVVGPILFLEAKEKVHGAPGGRRVLAPCRAQRPRDHGEEGPVDESVAVDQEQLGRRVAGHGPER